LPLIKTNATTAIATTIFYPFILFNQMQHRVVTTTCNSQVYNSQAIGPNIAAHQNVPWLDHLLTCDDTYERLTMLLINRHPEKRMTIEFSLDANVISVLELKAAHPLDANTFSHPYKVKLTSGKKPTKTESGYKTVLEPASILMIEFSRK
jgi:alpha-L-arabinofuranosidase